MVTRCLIGFLIALLTGFTVDAADENLPVQVTVTQAPSQEGEIKHTFSFDCQAVQTLPTLRIAFGKFREFSVSAGQQLTAGATENTAVGSVVVAARQLEDGRFILTFEIGPDGPLTVSRVMPLPAGQSLTDVVQLTSENQSAPYRRSVRLGQVSGAAVSAYVMPGRVPPKQLQKSDLKPPAADGAPVKMFETWAKGVKTGNLGLFARGYPTPQWQNWSEEERQERLHQYQQAFERVLGNDYDPAKLKAEYKGGVAKGVLQVTYEDQDLPELEVRRYGSQWILAED